MRRSLQISILVLSCMIIITALSLLSFKLTETLAKGEVGITGLAGSDETIVPNTKTTVVPTGTDARLIIPQNILFVSKKSQKTVTGSFSVIFVTTSSLLSSQTLGLFNLSQEWKPLVSRCCLGILCQPLNTTQYASVLFDDSLEPNVRFLVRNSSTFFAGDRFTGNMSFTYT